MQNNGLSIGPEEFLLDWTGHPLVDVGIATLCAMRGKEDPRELTLEDLDQAADLMADYYFSGLMTSYLTCVFMNSAYVQPNMSNEKRKEYENRVLRAHRFFSSGSDVTKCPFSSKEPSASIHRGQLPLLTGEDVLNFYPAGRGFLPIYGPYLVALQALPLGGRRTEGRLLVAHADETALTLEFARKYLADNQRLLGLVKSGGLPKKSGPTLELEREHAAGESKNRPKYPDAKASRSLIAYDLMEIYRTRTDIAFANRWDISLTAYWLSNSGQGASLDIFHIPSEVVRFLRKADSAEYGRQWRKLVNGTWRVPSGQGKKGPTIAGGPGRSGNHVLSDLFAIYENGFLDFPACRRFLQRYLLRINRQWGGGEDADIPEMTDLSLTELFLKEVMGLDQKRVESIKAFADRLAAHIRASNDRGLFRNLVFAKRPWEMRNALTKAQRNQAKDRGELLFGLDEYMEIFEADDAVGNFDWGLTRDLVSIRLVENLHREGFFAKGNEELLSEPEPTEQAIQ